MIDDLKYGDKHGDRKIRSRLAAERRDAADTGPDDIIDSYKEHPDPKPPRRLPIWQVRKLHRRT